MIAAAVGGPRFPGGHRLALVLALMVSAIVSFAQHGRDPSPGRPATVSLAGVALSGDRYGR